MRSHVPATQHHFAPQPPARAASFHDARPQAQALQRLQCAGTGSARVSQLMALQTLMSANAPVAQCIIGQIDASLGTTKVSRRKTGFSKTQILSNEMRTIMDEAEALAESTVERSWPALPDAAVEGADEEQPQRDNQAIETDRLKLIDSLNKARGKQYWIEKEPYTVGMPRDAGVDETLEYYSGWQVKILKSLRTIEDNQIASEDAPEGDAPSVDRLDNGMPTYFSTLVRTGKLTLKPGSRDYPGGNAGRAFDFNETKEWTLHVHHSKISEPSRAHYKPKGKEYSVGYAATNPVSETSLIRLGAF